ncbi:hypothetical protein [Actinoalloteichus caeruleus]|uniref:hypothetical protein n=1 Tax=Actinoalloteichus cyanogriseus TaxID=2893586 RepID=UPI003AACC433
MLTYSDQARNPALVAAEEMWPEARIDVGGFLPGWTHRCVELGVHRSDTSTRLIAKYGGPLEGDAVGEERRLSLLRHVKRVHRLGLIVPRAQAASETVLLMPRIRGHRWDTALARGLAVTRAVLATATKLAGLGPTVLSGLPNTEDSPIRSVQLRLARMALLVSRTDSDGFATARALIAYLAERVLSMLPVPRDRHPIWGNLDPDHVLFTPAGMVWIAPKPRVGELAEDSARTLSRLSLLHQREPREGVRRLIQTEIDVVIAHTMRFYPAGEYEEVARRLLSWWLADTLAQIDSALPPSPELSTSTPPRRLAEWLRRNSGDVLSMWRQVLDSPHQHAGDILVDLVARIASR